MGARRGARLVTALAFVAGTVFAATVCAGRALAGRRSFSGTIVVAGAALDDGWFIPSEKNPRTSASTARPPAITIPRRCAEPLIALSIGIDIRVLERRGPAWAGPRLSRPSRGSSEAPLAPLRAGLLPRRRADRGHDAVVRRGRREDGDVLDAGVVGGLEHRRGDARVAVVVGVVGLHARNGGAHVRLSGRVVRTRLELQVRRDRDRKQDPEDDDHDEELDEREALVAPQPLPKCVH